MDCRPGQRPELCKVRKKKVRKEQLLHRRVVHRQNRQANKRDLTSCYNKEVALALACIISTVKTMMLAHEEGDPFFVQNEVYQEQRRFVILLVSMYT